jgi:hypothetical protein
MPFKNSISGPVVFVFLNGWLFYENKLVQFLWCILAQVYYYNPIMSHRQSHINWFFGVFLGKLSYCTYNRLKTEYSALVCCVVSVQKQINNLATNCQMAKLSQFLSVHSSPRHHKFSFH